MRKPCLVTSTRPRSARAGFTLVELLVAMSLTIFIMVILVEAFSTAMDTFAGLRSLGDMQENLRTALQTIRYDLEQDHFEGGRKLSDSNFWTEPRREGFFYMRGSNPATLAEGNDAANLPSRRATDHILHFSNRMRGNRRENFYTTGNAGTVTGRVNSAQSETYYGTDTTLGVTSQWGEMGYFLVSTGTKVPDNPNITLFNLYKTSLVTLPFADTVGTTTITISPVTAQRRISYATDASGNWTKYLSPNDFAAGTGTTYRSADWSNWPTSGGFVPSTRPKNLVCANVTSFQIRFLRHNNGTTWNDFTATPYTFDSTTEPTNPSFRITALQVILRVYDPSSGLSRQAALLLDM